MKVQITDTHKIYAINYVEDLKGTESLEEIVDLARQEFIRTEPTSLLAKDPDIYFNIEVLYTDCFVSFSTERLD